MTSQSANWAATMLNPVLEIPAVDRTRRNHGLEHATITILSGRVRGTSLVGRSTPNGFHLYGNVTTQQISEAAHEALSRMRAGEVGLAVHPNCGTNFVTAGIFAGLAAYIGFMGANSGSARRERLPLVAAMATMALILAQPFGMEIQRYITTSGDVRDLQIARIDERLGRVRWHFVATVG